MLQLRSGLRRVRRVAHLCLSLLLPALAPELHAASLPTGFTETVIAQGLSSPTAMQFAPDGRLFVCQQGGALRVIKNGSLLATPFVSIAVNSSGERGLLGVAFDPGFATNQYVYVYYTTSTAPIHNRVSRFTASGDVAVPGSEVVIVDLDSLSATNHNGGAIAFGPDGKLYIAVGDNAVASNAQSLANRHGKMLRINPDGSIPPDNPTTFPGISGSPSFPNTAIWAVGLRNPFTFALNPGGTPGVMINDVGAGAWEEVNPAAAGSNLGWPTTEGDFNPATFPNFTRPRYAYSSAVNPECAITGGTFYNPASATFPPEYVGTYFFADFCAGWIKRIDPTAVFPYPTLTAPIDFAAGISNPVDLKIGPDGNLYYLARGNGRVYRVQYAAAPQAPSITSHPADVTVATGQAATFTVVASGTAPLSYQWQRNNLDISGATAASYTLTNAQPSDNGATFRVNVSNSVGNVFSNAATLTVTTNQSPLATITEPAAGTLYAGGMTVAFAGTGTDPEDGTLPASAFTWQVDFHHDTHFHPFLPATPGITSGTFDIPTTGETSANVWYRIYLTVRDSSGLSTTVQRDVRPQVVQLTLESSPAGLQMTLDGQPAPAPIVVMSVVGMQRAIEAPDQATAGASHFFASWSDGGNSARVILTPSVDTTYTATFSGLTAGSPPTSPANLIAVVNGSTVHLSWRRSSGAQSYRLEAGSAAGLVDLARVDVGDVASVQGRVPVGTYVVRVRAVNSVGVSGPSNEVRLTVATAAACATPPPAPAGFTGQTGGLLVALAWQPSPGASAYVLEAGPTRGSTTGSASVGTATLFQAVAPRGTYFSRVRAVNACGSSEPSGELPVTLRCSSQAVVPANLTLVKAGGAASFGWLAPLGATSYRLQAGSVAGASNLLDTDIGPGTSLTVALGGVPAGTYYVRVVAVSFCGVGAPSNEVILTVP